MALAGGTIVVGEIFATTGTKGDTGAAYLFTGSGSSWSQAAELTASDGAAGDGFGDSVGIAGTAVVVGAESASIGGRGGQGAAYIFLSTGSSWTQAAKITAPDGAAADGFGSSVAFSGGAIAVGAPGAAVGGKSQEAQRTSSGGRWQAWPGSAPLRARRRAARR